MCCFLSVTVPAYTVPSVSHAPFSLGTSFVLPRSSSVVPVILAPHQRTVSIVFPAHLDIKGKLAQAFLDGSIGSIKRKERASTLLKHGRIRFLLLTLFFSLSAKDSPFSKRLFSAGILLGGGGSLSPPSSLLLMLYHHHKIKDFYSWLNKRFLFMADLFSGTFLDSCVALFFWGERGGGLHRLSSSFRSLTIFTCFFAYTLAGEGHFGWSSVGNGRGEGVGDVSHRGSTGYVGGWRCFPHVITTQAGYNYNGGQLPSWTFFPFIKCTITALRPHYLRPFLLPGRKSGAWVDLLVFYECHEYQQSRKVEVQDSCVQCSTRETRHARRERGGKIVFLPLIGAWIYLPVCHLSAMKMASGSPLSLRSYWVALLSLVALFAMTMHHHHHHLSPTLSFGLP